MSILESITFPDTFFYSSIGIGKGTLATEGIIFILPNVIVAICKNSSSLSVTLVILPLTSVYFAIVPSVGAKAVLK